MLRLESEIVINRAVGQCALEGNWVVAIHDGLVSYPEHVERVTQIMVESFGSVGIKPTIEVTAFNQEAQYARCGDPGSWVDDRASYFLELTERAVGGLVRGDEIIMATNDDQQHEPEQIDRRRLFPSVGGMLLFFVLGLFLPAGTWMWTKGWLFILVIVVASILRICSKIT
jgi:hypothetical protein